MSRPVREEDPVAGGVVRRAQRRWIPGLKDSSVFCQGMTALTGCLTVLFPHKCPGDGMALPVGSGRPHL